MNGAKTNVLRVVIGSVLIALLLTLSLPLVSASTVHIDLNPTTGIAEVIGVSTTTIVFAYPANSTVSKFMNGTNYSFQASGNIEGGQSPAQDFQDALRNYTSDITVQNMTASIRTTANANTTAMVITRETNITASVSGVFNVTNGTVTANLNWKAFEIRGPFVVPLNGHDYDLNMMGSAAVMPFGDTSLVSSFLRGSFGDRNIWSRPTIDFSALNTSLINWTKVYNSSTNTTTFTKTVNTLENFSSTISFNGQSYTLSMRYDPSSTIRVSGYATPSGNTLVIGQAPQNYTLPALSLAVVVMLAALAYLVIRKRRGSIARRSIAPSVTNQKIVVKC